MNDLISRQAAIDFLEERPQASGYSNAALVSELNRSIGYLMKLPSAQRTGRWKVSDIPKGKMKYCSECGFGQYIADERQYGYCPNCGARMEVEE